jgi:hypothetical protein
VVPRGGSLRPWLHRLHGLTIGENVWISQFCLTWTKLRPESISIGNTFTISLRTF